MPEKTTLFGRSPQEWLDIEAERDRFKTALEFYAKRDSWIATAGGAPAWRDNGDRAYNALYPNVDCEIKLSEVVAALRAPNAPVPPEEGGDAWDAAAEYLLKRFRP